MSEFGRAGEHDERALSSILTKSHSSDNDDEFVRCKIGGERSSCCGDAVKEEARETGTRWPRVMLSNMELMSKMARASDRSLGVEQSEEVVEPAGRERTRVSEVHGARRKERVKQIKS